MEELKKIDLSNSNNDTSITETKEPKSPKSFPKKILVILGVVFLVFVFSLFAIVLPAQKVYSSASKTMNQAKVAWDAIKKQNIALADEELKKTRKELTQTQKDLNSISYLRFIPIVGGYYNDADHFVKAGFYFLDASNVLIESIEPYADILGLKGQGSFVMGSAEKRIQTAILTMGKITPRIDDIAEAVVLAQKEVDQVNVNHYPSFIAGGKIRSQLETLKKVTDEGVVFVSDAKPLIKVLPSLLGESKEKKYLIIFQNDKELRPTGGFMTAYAVFRIDKGVIHVDRSGDMYTLDNTIRSHPKAPEPILKYLPKVTTFNLRDTNLSPDFVTSMKTFNSLYKDASGKVDVDGIIALDTDVLASTIKILDDEVYAGGVRFTSQIDKRCNCPQVVYQLEQITDKPLSLDLRVTSLETAQATRKDIIGVLMYAIMEKALKSSPKKYWGPLFQDMITQASQKHVLAYLYNSDAQQGLEALNASGRIKQFDGDYLHINEANFGGAKANMYVKESVTQNFETDNGGIVKTVTINYKNPFPPSDCNLERGNLCLNAILRNWVRIYVPKGSELISSQGSEVKVTSHEELGKTVFEGFLTVRPLGAATYTIKYRLPFKLANGSPLPLLIQKQPGTDDNEYTINVKGKQVGKYPLLTDKEIKISL